MSRKPVIFGNWKMNKTPKEAAEFFQGIAGYVKGTEAADYGIGAPYVDLDIAVKNAGPDNATGVAITPGVDFATSRPDADPELDGNHVVRISFCGNGSQLDEGIDRLVAHLGR